MADEPAAAAQLGLWREGSRLALDRFGPVVPHDLRHVAACWMLFDLGLDAAVVAEKLGHADPSFTVKRYVGVRGNPDAAAMEVTDSW